MASNSILLTNRLVSGMIIQVAFRTGILKIIWKCPIQFRVWPKQLSLWGSHPVMVCFKNPKKESSFGSPKTTRPSLPDYFQGMTGWLDKNVLLEFRTLRSPEAWSPTSARPGETKSAWGGSKTKSQLSHRHGKKKQAPLIKLIYKKKWAVTKTRVICCI